MEKGYLSRLKIDGNEANLLDDAGRDAVNNSETARKKKEMNIPRGRSIP